MHTQSHRGFDAVPAQADDIFGLGESEIGPSTPFKFEDLAFPETELIKKTREFIKKELVLPTYHHSERVFYLGQAIARDHFRGHTLDLEAYYLSALFHDIGCSDKNLRATKMSFEFYGGIIARDWLLKHGADQELADSVAETIFRHTDFVTGNLTLHGQIIQLATLLDNLGARQRLIHDETYASIVSHFHREGWSSCFADTMQTELDIKPWSHTTALLKDNFVTAARQNPYGKRFEKQ